jgi:hypothetical protein
VSLTISRLPHELRNSVPALEQLEYGIAVTDEGQVVAFYALDLRQQTQNCNVCVRRCGVFAYLWTDEEYRGAQVFTQIRDFLHADLGVDKIYTKGGGTKDSDVYGWKYNAAARTKDYTPARVDYDQAVQKAIQVKALLQEAIS